MPVISFISRMTIKEGREADFIKTVTALRDRVHREEKDALIFEFYKLRAPRRYCVLESFPSEAIEHAHMTGPLLAEFIARIVDCVDGTWEREYLDPLE